MIITKMKEISEAYIGKEVKNSVVTVPAYSSSNQRCQFNFRSKRSLNYYELTAVMNTYGLNRKDNEKNVLLFDLEGSAFDVSLFKIEGGIYQIKATTGATHFGAEDVDNRMVDYFLQDFNRHSRITRLRISGHSIVYESHVSLLNVRFLPSPRHILKSIRFLKVLTSTARSCVLDLYNYVWTISRSAWILSKYFFVMQNCKGIS